MLASGLPDRGGGEVQLTISTWKIFYRKNVQPIIDFNNLTHHLRIDNHYSYTMGNNHQKYFGSDKRKIVLLGLEKSGKSTLLEYIKTQQYRSDIPRTKNLNIQDIPIGSLLVTFFDLSGGLRQRVFWKQQYEGTQGIIFLIDSYALQERQTSLTQLEKIVKHFQTGLPIAVCLTKLDLVQSIQWGKLKADLSKLFQQKYANFKQIRVWEIDYKNKETIKSMMSWFLNQTRPI